MVNSLDYMELKLDDNGAFVVSTFLLPKNTLDVQRFAGAFTAMVEEHIYNNARVKIANMSKEDKEVPANIEFIDMVNEYNNQRSTFDFTTITKEDETFIRNMIYSFKGFPKVEKGVKLGIAGHVLLDDVLASELPKYYANNKVDLKALKPAFNEWVNDRLQTNNESGLFKNFKVKFTDEMTLRVLAATKKDIILTNKGIKDKDTALPIIAQKILTVALDKTFDWRFGKIVKVSSTREF